MSQFRLTNPRSVTYTYGAYANLLTETRQVDENTYYKLENTLTSNGKSIASSKEYTSSDGQNYTEITSSTFTYNNAGNLTSSVRGNESRLYTYTYNSDGTYSLQAKARGLTDADGAALPDSIETTVFDFWGRPSSVTNANGNVTRYTYDLLSRTLTVTAPDNTVTSYTYDSINNITTATYPNGGREKVVFNPYGGFTNAYVDASGADTPVWQEVESRTYDTYGRITEAKSITGYNGSGTADTGTVMRYTYFPFDMIKTEEKRTLAGTIVDKLTYSYDMASTSGDYVTDTGIASTTMTKNSASASLYCFINAENATSLPWNATRKFDKNLFANPSANSTVYTTTIHADGKYAYIYGKPGYYCSHRIQLYNGDTLLHEGLYGNDIDAGTAYTPLLQNIEGIETLTMKNKVNAQYSSTRKLVLAEPALLTMHDYKNGVGENYTKVTVTRDAGDGLTPPEVTRFYNRDGQLVKEKTKDGSTLYTATWLYDKSGRLTEVRDAEAFSRNIPYSQKYEYDVHGNVIKEYNAMGDSRTMTYDTLDRLTAETDFLGNSTAYTYDGMGRQIKSTGNIDTNVTGVVKSYYDAVGNLTKTDNGSQKVLYTYDNMNRLSTAQEAPDTSSTVYTQYGYDSMGNCTVLLTGLSAPLADVNAAYNPETATHAKHTYTYNRLGQLTAETDPYGDSVTYTYSVGGNVLSKTDRAGIVTTYTYDTRGRLINESAAKDGNTESIAYTYDRYDNLKTQGEIAYTYDNLFRLIEEERSGHVNHYTYDAMGNRLTHVMDVGSAPALTESYTYDNAGRMTAYSGTGGGEEISASYAYNQNGALTQSTSGAHTTLYTYTPAGQVKTMQYKNGDTVEDTITYTYYATGNLRKMQSGDVETTYNYNPRGFLRSAVENYDEASVTRSYAYDLFGNQDYSYSMNTDNYDYYHSYYDYDKNNRLIEEEYASDIKNDENVVVSTDIRTIYTYDANGNQLTSASTYTSGTQNGTTFKTTANTYNLRGQLSGVSVTENGTTSSMQYLYDSDGLLKRKTADSYENFYWDNGQLSVQMSGVGSQYRMYFRGMMLHGARTRTEMYHYRQNAHGDVIWMSTGIDTKTYFYDPFGQQVGENGLPSTDTADENSLRYCGEYFDTHSGNYYLRNRYYNAETGRFTQEDPIRDGLNWYVYCGNNPVMFVDPLGMSPGDLVNTDGCTSQQISNIHSAVHAYKSGVISKKEMAMNIVKNGGTIELYDGVDVSVEGSVVNIIANVYVENRMYEQLTEEKIVHSPSLYSSSVKKGIEDEWSGVFSGLNISVQVNYITKEELQIYDSAIEIILEISKGKKDYPQATGNRINLYNRDGRGSLAWYDIETFKKVVAHEFGHAAFQMSDLYLRNEYRHVNSIMNNHLYGVFPVDYARMFASHWFKKTAYYTEEGTSAIVGKYM